MLWRKSPEESDLLIKRAIETFKNEAKEQKVGLLGMLLGILCVPLLRNLLVSTGVRAGYPSWLRKN